jgi:hypothetical protein
MLYILVIFLIILIICIACCSRGNGKDAQAPAQAPADKNNGMYYGLGFLIFFIIVIIVLFAVTWPEMEVDKSYSGRARKRVMWVNTNGLDVNSEEDRAWCNNLMMNQAPNRIGVLIVKAQQSGTTDPSGTTAPEQFVQNEKMTFLSAYEKFTMLFGHPPKAVKFKGGKPDKDTKRFIKEKMVKLNKNNIFRRRVRK